MTDTDIVRHRIAEIDEERERLFERGEEWSRGPALLAERALLVELLADSEAAENYRKGIDETPEGE